MTGVVALILVGVGVVIWHWSSHRRQLLWGAVFTLPVVVYNIVVAGSLQRIGINHLDAIWTLVKVTLGVASTGAIAAVVYESTINHWLTPVTDPNRHRMLWLVLGVLVAGILSIVGVPLLLAMVIGLIVNTGITFIIGRQLFWDSVVGALGFGLWFAAADLVFGLRVSGDASRLLIGSNAIGFTIAGLSVERIVVAAALGALLSPLFVALKRQRVPDRPLGTATSTAKLVIVTVVVVITSMLSAGFTVAYVQPPTVTTMTPTVGATGLPPQTSIQLHFSRPVDRDTLRIHLQPDVNGSWQFSDPAFGGHAFHTAVFVPDVPFPNDSRVQGVISGIESVWGVPADSQSIDFTIAPAPVTAPVTHLPEPPPSTVAVVTSEPVPVTVEPTADTVEPPTTPAVTNPTTVTAADASHQTLLSVALDYQDRPLSCEAAALKMALANKGVKVSETQIMNLVGYDPTPHKNGIWGDPYQAFVGNIDGKQNTTGYGVYWDPIARAARQWRPARVITNGSLKDLTVALDAQQAIVIWGTLGRAYRETWKTPQGKTISAWKGEHARTLIGYVGTQDKPTKFIINDPVAGRLNWSTATFSANWAAFNNSAVIVE